MVLCRSSGAKNFGCSFFASSMMSSCSCSCSCSTCENHGLQD